MTLFGWLIIVSGVLVVFSAWETVGSAGSLETTDLLRTMMEEAPFRGMGLEQLREAYRITAIVAAAAAGGAAVFAVTAMKRDRAARLALSVLAVPVMLAGFVMGGFSSTLLAVGALMLWLYPSRDWFNGEDYVPPEPRSVEPERKSASPWAAPTADQRRADGTAPPTPASRPRALTRACIVTWVFAGLTLVLSLIALLALLADRTAMLTELRQQDPSIFEQGIAEQQLLSLVTVGLGMVALWCVTAIVLSVYARRGAEWARVGLLVTAVLSGLLCLAAAFVNPGLFGVALACAFTVGLLTRRDVVGWTRWRSRAGSAQREEMVP